MLEHSQEERSSNMRRWGAGCLQTGKSGSERGCRMILTRDIRSSLYRFKGKDHFDSFCYPQSGFSLTHDNRVCLSKIGTIKVKIPKGKKACPMLGSQKTCTVKREGEQWYLIIVCEAKQEVVYHPGEEAVGIDLGLL